LGFAVHCRYLALSEGDLLLLFWIISIVLAVLAGFAGARIKRRKLRLSFLLPVAFAPLLLPFVIALVERCDLPTGDNCYGANWGVILAVLALPFWMICMALGYFMGRR
jgi:ABC-type glycerol-3-phosphate transport system permease component